jgi:outer membrane usher protein
MATVRCNSSLRRWVGSFIAFAILLASLAMPQGQAAESRAFLEFTLNTVKREPALVLLRTTGIRIRVSDLADAGLLRFGGDRTTVDGMEFVSLPSLAPGITFAYDEEKLSLSLTARPEYFGATTLELGQRGEHATLDRTARSGFVNYALTSNPSSGYTGFFETGLTLDGALLYSSFDRSETGFGREISNLTFDDPQHVRRLVIGDAVQSGGLLGSAFQFAGVSISRAYDVNPYFIRNAAPGLSGTVLTPSTVDVYVNGQLTREEQIAPGAFDLRDLPVVGGANTTSIVIRDAFGRTQTIGSPYYLVPELLRRGLTDYSYNLGFRSQTALSGQGSTYGPLSAMGRYQLGLSNSFNAGARIEAGGGRISGGPSLIFSSPIGEFALSAASSSARHHHGSAASLAYNYTDRRLSFGADAAVQSRYYATLGLAPLADRALLDSSIFAGFAAGKLATVSLRYDALNDREIGHGGGPTVSTDVQLDRETSLFLSVGRSHFTSGNATTFSLNLNRLLGRTASVSTAVNAGPDGTTSSLELQKPAPTGLGLGYRLDVSDAASGAALDGDARYQGTYGDYELLLNRPTGGGSTATVSLAGGVAAIGGGLYATRPITQSFALVDTGVPGVRTYLSNQEIGRTDRSGRLLVSGLSPYSDNQLSIAPEDTPMNYLVEASQHIVDPGARAGSVVRFPVHKYQAFAGRALIADGNRELVPAYGKLRLTPVNAAAGVATNADLDGRGVFYLEGLSAGRYAAEITASQLDLPDAGCRFALTLPRSDAPIVKLGTLHCSVGQRQ